MRSRPRKPSVLTIAGSDSGGGAGVQADLKVCFAMGVHGLTAITCVTAQNPSEVLDVVPLDPAKVDLQLSAVFDEFRPSAVKTGMLYSRGIIEVVANWAAERPAVRWVVDPVMVATSGAKLLDPGAIDALRSGLLPKATVITPNRDEAEILAEMAIDDLEGLRRAGCVLAKRYGCAVLVKGGHLDGDRAVDVFVDGRGERLFSAKRIRGVSSHGTGCTYSAAIAAYLALGWSLTEAVRHAKAYITRAIARTYRAGRHLVLDQGR